jgi:hypothetical protein
MYVCTVYLYVLTFSLLSNSSTRCQRDDKQPPTIHFLSTSPHNATPDHSHTLSHTHNRRRLSRPIDQVCASYPFSVAAATACVQWTASVVTRPRYVHTFTYESLSVWYILSLLGDSLSILTGRSHNLTQPCISDFRLTVQQYFYQYRI